jgi:hypothetical protein
MVGLNNSVEKKGWIFYFEINDWEGNGFFF